MLYCGYVKATGGTGRVMDTMIIKGRTLPRCRQAYSASLLQLQVPLPRHLPLPLTSPHRPGQVNAHNGKPNPSCFLCASCPHHFFELTLTLALTLLLVPKAIHTLPEDEKVVMFETMTLEGPNLKSEPDLEPYSNPPDASLFLSEW